MPEEKQPEASANYVIEIKKKLLLINPYSSNLSPIQTNPNNHIKKIKTKIFAVTTAYTRTNKLELTH